MLIKAKIALTEDMISELWDKQLNLLQEFNEALVQDDYIEAFDLADKLNELDDEICRSVTKKKLLGIQLTEQTYKIKERMIRKSGHYGTKA